MNSELIDQIYEASFIPELWPNLLDELATQTEGRGGLLLTVREKDLNWTASDGVREDFASYLKDGWFQRCGRRVCMFKKAHTEFLRENDYWTEEEFEENDVYKEFFRPRGLGYSAGTGLAVPTGDRMVLFVERSFDRGFMEKSYVDQLNEVRPHLARSALMSARLGLKNASGASDALGRLGLATVLLNAKGIALETANLDDGVNEIILSGAHGEMGFKDRDANAQLKFALEHLSELGKKSINSFPVRNEDGDATYVAHLLPITGSVHDIFSGSYAILCITPVSAKSAPPLDLVRSLFDFTASEARVARSLAAGKTADEIATDGNVAVSTVRTQIRHVLEKTGCHRQVDVVALMAGLSLER